MPGSDRGEKQATCNAHAQALGLTREQAGDPRAHLSRSVDRLD
jgi:hypothetical protein